MDNVEKIEEIKTSILEKIKILTSSISEDSSSSLDARESLAIKNLVDAYATLSELGGI